MSQLVRPVDAADRLRLDLTAIAREHGIPLACSCDPLPADFDSRLPFAWIRQLGGQRTGMVVDRPMLTVGVYAAGWARAAAVAADAYAIVQSLPFTPGTLTDWTACSPLSLPYEDPDPDHPNIPRCSFTVNMTVKGVISD